MTANSPVSCLGGSGSLPLSCHVRVGYPSARLRAPLFTSLAMWNSPDIPYPDVAAVVLGPPVMYIYIYIYVIWFSCSHCFFLFQSIITHAPNSSTSYLSYLNSTFYQHSSADLYLSQKNHITTLAIMSNGGGQGGGYYKYRCKHFYTYNCMNWVWVNYAACATCLVRSRIFSLFFFSPCKAGATYANLLTGNGTGRRIGSRAIGNTLRDSRTPGARWHVVLRINLGCPSRLYRIDLNIQCRQSIFGRSQQLDHQP